MAVYICKMCGAAVTVETPDGTSFKCPHCNVEQSFPGTENVFEPISEKKSDVNVPLLLKNAFIALRSSNWTDANNLFSQIIVATPDNAYGYFGKLMAETQVTQEGELAQANVILEHNPNYAKIFQCNDINLQQRLTAYNEQSKANVENIYANANARYSGASNQNDFIAAAELFNKIPDYKDSTQKRLDCVQKAESARKDEIYNIACRESTSNNPFALENAIARFNSIPGWRDSDQKKNQAIINLNALTSQTTQNNTYTEDYASAENYTPAESFTPEENYAPAVAPATNSKNKAATLSIIVVVVATLLVIAIILGFFVILPQSKYNKAVDMMNSGDYNGAYEIFADLDEYKDSYNRKYECRYKEASAAFENEDYKTANEIFSQIGNYEDSDKMAEKSLFMLHKTALSKAEAGSVIQFGFYEQDGKTGNEKEPIDWIVLDTKGNRALLVSVYALDCQKYNNQKIDVTWANSSIREWLNDNFYKEAFNADYQSLILPTDIKTPDNPKHGTEGGTNTTDKVFLLSYEEADTYFESNAARKASPTEYAKTQGVETISTQNCWWWLRTPGIYAVDVCGVHDTGAVDDLGCYVNNDQAGVRPAMWVTIP